VGQTTTMGFDNPIHIALLLVVVLLVFGAKRLPELGRSIGGVKHEFRRGIAPPDGPPAPAPALVAIDEGSPLPSSPSPGDGHRR
jgi:TatA/E family protein of Tat protein translocase